MNRWSAPICSSALPFPEAFTALSGPFIDAGLGQCVLTSNIIVFIKRRRGVGLMKHHFFITLVVLS